MFCKEMSNEYFQSLQRPECTEAFKLHKPLWNLLNIGPSNYTSAIMNVWTNEYNLLTHNFKKNLLRTFEALCHKVCTKLGFRHLRV